MVTGVIFVSVGLPGRFAKWCEGVIGRVAGAHGETVALTASPSLNDMLNIWPTPSPLEGAARALISEAPTHLVVGAYQPDEHLRVMLSEADARFVVVLDDPRIAVADMLAETGAEPAAAIRAIANCCALVMRFASLPGALALRPGDAQLDGAGTIIEIARHLRLPSPEARATKVLGDIRDDVTAAAAASSAPVIAHDADQTTWGALGGYCKQFSGRDGMEQIVWRRDLFFLHSAGLSRPIGAIDLAGPPRTLVHGPYVHLPPGRWSARVLLGVSPEAAGNALLIDALADARQLGFVVLAPKSGGVHAADIEFEVEEPSEKGLEIRVLLTNPCPRGRLAFGNVVLQPLAAGKPNAISSSMDFEAVLNL